MQKIINPFINNLRVPYIEVIKSIKGTGDNTVVDSYKVEAEDYTRVYTSKSRREFIFSLSMYARDLFIALHYFTHSEYKYVIITYEKVLELYSGKYGKRRYDDTIRELIKYSVIDIKDKEKGEYWYNPTYYSPTNRTKLFEECIYKIRTSYASNKSIKAEESHENNTQKILQNG